MNSTFEVFLCGPDSAPFVADCPRTDIRLTAAAETTIGQTSADALNACIAASLAEFVCIADLDAPPPESACREAASLFAAEPQTHLALVPFAAGELRSQVWRQISPHLASLVSPPQTFAWLAVRRTAFQSVGLFADVVDPLWEWLVRAIEKGSSVGLVDMAAVTQSAHSLPELVPRRAIPAATWLAGRIDAAIEQAIENTRTPASRNRHSNDDAIALRAGLFQLFDDLDASHTQAQGIEGRGRHRAGDYWHAIVHRREPDFSNSKYWFRHVGSHPIFETLANRARLAGVGVPEPDLGRWQRLFSGRWDPFAFVDLCEQCQAAPDNQLSRAVRQIQLDEMLLLLVQTFQDARID